MTQAAPTPARRVDQLLAHYEVSHCHPVNEAIHMVAVPLIMLSIVGLLFALHPGVAIAFLAASMVYYVRLGSRLFLWSMTAIALLMFWLVELMGEQRLLMCTVIFVVSWIFQFIGHKIEGRKPSFLEDLQYLWVGPLFVLSRVFRRLDLAW